MRPYLRHEPAFISPFFPPYVLCFICDEQAHALLLLCRLCCSQPAAYAQLPGTAPVGGAHGSPAASLESDPHPLSSTPLETARQMPQEVGSVRVKGGRLSPMYSLLTGGYGATPPNDTELVCWLAFECGFWDCPCVIEALWKRVIFPGRSLPGLSCLCIGLLDLWVSVYSLGA